MKNNGEATHRFAGGFLGGQKALQCWGAIQVQVAGPAQQVKRGDQAE